MDENKIRMFAEFNARMIISYPDRYTLEESCPAIFRDKAAEYIDYYNNITSGNMTIEDVPEADRSYVAQLVRLARPPKKN